MERQFGKQKSTEEKRQRESGNIRRVGSTVGVSQGPEQRVYPIANAHPVGWMAAAAAAAAVGFSSAARRWLTKRCGWRGERGDLRWRGAESESDAPFATGADCASQSFGSRRPSLGTSLLLQGPVRATTTTTTTLGSERGCEGDGDRLHTHT